MYCRDQILIHKETKKLARLYNQPKGSLWAWSIGENTAFIDENKKIFADNIKSYTHLKDLAGNPLIPDSFEEAKELIKKISIGNLESIFNDWYTHLLNKMKTEYEINHVFCNSNLGCGFYSKLLTRGKCFDMEDFFIKKMKAKPLFILHRDTPWKDIFSSMLVFQYKRIKWLIVDGSLKRIKKVVVV